MPGTVLEVGHIQMSQTGLSTVAQVAGAASLVLNAGRQEGREGEGKW